MPQVFIVYATDGSAIADDIEAAIKHKKRRSNIIRIAQALRVNTQSLQQTIASSDAVLLLFTAGATSSNIAHEFQSIFTFAVQQRKTLYPVQIDGTSLPTYININTFTITTGNRDHIEYLVRDILRVPPFEWWRKLPLYGKALLGGLVVFLGLLFAFIPILDNPVIGNFFCNLTNISLPSCQTTTPSPQETDITIQPTDTPQPSNTPAPTNIVDPPTPTFILTNTPEPPTVSVKQNGVALYSGPGDSYEQIAEANRGDKFSVVAQAKLNEITYYLIALDNGEQRAWVDSSTVQIKATYGQVPLAATIPPIPCGQLLLVENFNDASLPPTWLADRENWATVLDNGNMVYRMVGGGLSNLSIGDTAWDDYTLEFDVKPTSLDLAKAVIVDLRATDVESTRIILSFDFASNSLYLFKAIPQNKNIPQLIRTTSYSFSENSWLKVRIDINGSTLRVVLDDTPLLNFHVIDPSISHGFIQFKAYSQYVVFDNIHVSSLENCPPG